MNFNMFTVAATFLTAAIGLVMGSGAATPPKPTVRPVPLITVAGASTIVSGAKVQTWARLGGDLKVQEVGVTLPLKVVETPPDKPGNGPSGAVAVLAFPKVVQNSTYFNHFEMQWNPHGHPPACCFGVPHFDFHFYAAPVSFVSRIGITDPQPPATDRIPDGFIYPGPNECVPQMGVHAVRPGDMKPNEDFKAVMIAGFFRGNMHFVEPMVTRAFLQERHSFDLDVPRPPSFGRFVRYPTRFSGTYDPIAKTYQLVFSNFENRS